MKKIVFVEGFVYWDTDSPCGYMDWYNTQRAIDRGDQVIYTSQMGMMSFDLIDKGYEIFLVDHAHPTPIQLKPNRNKGLTKRMSRSCNLFKAWKAGKFNKLEYSDSKLRRKK